MHLLVLSRRSLLSMISLLLGKYEQVLSLQADVAADNAHHIVIIFPASVNMA